MKLSVENLGKQYNHRWIFRNIGFTVATDSIFGITGENGSGKSTLLQIIADYIVPDEGHVYRLHDNGSQIEFSPGLISIASPYLELFEEFTVEECVVLQGKFKSWRNNLAHQDIIDRCVLSEHANKPVMNLSSGMKQRLKLGMAIMADTPLLLLDEPCSNLDAKFSLWFNELLQGNSADRTVVICSNKDSREINQCTSVFDINTGQIS